MASGNYAGSQNQGYPLLAPAACLGKEALSHMKSVHIPLAKTSHMANLTIDGTGKYTLIQGKRHMTEYLLNNSLVYHKAPTSLDQLTTEE